MKKPIEELDYQKTARGELILRRRILPQDGQTVVYEVILNGEFLMTSLFHESEDALARLALEEIGGRTGGIRLVVGGLGLGYTALAALESRAVSEVRVIEVFPEVIAWHEAGVLPIGRALREDARCILQAGNFFEASAGAGFDPKVPERKFDGILLDIDHTPAHWLHPDHGQFYQTESLLQLKRHLNEGGVFALWSDGQPAASFTERLREVFPSVRSALITFANRLTGGESVGTVYLAR